MLLDDCCVVVVIVSVWSCYFGHFLFLTSHFRSPLRKYAQGKQQQCDLALILAFEKKKEVALGWDVSSVNENL